MVQLSLTGADDSYIRHGASLFRFAEVLNYSSLVIWSCFLHNSLVMVFIGGNNGGRLAPTTTRRLPFSE